MDITTHQSDQWSFLERIWMEHAGEAAADLMLQNLPALRANVEAAGGELHFLTQAGHPFEFVGAVALTIQCGVVRIHFYFVRQRFRSASGDTLRAIYRTTDEYGRARSYGYVFVPAPIGVEFESQHQLLKARSVDDRDDHWGEHPIKLYSIPRAQFERLLR